MRSWFPTAMALALLCCATQAPLAHRPDIGTVSVREPALWIDGFEKPLNLLRVEDARELHAAWSRALAHQPALSKSTPRYLQPNKTVSSKDLARALGFAIPKLARAIDRTRAGEFLDADIGELRQVAEVHRALELNFKDPVPLQQSLELGLARTLFASFGAYTVVRDESRTTHAAEVGDPANSSFWTRPQDISRLELRIGFGRSRTLAVEVRNRAEPCAFDGAKTGYGTNPGFTIRCRDKRIKVKFREVRSEPFATRIFWALGYNVEPADYLSALDFTYSAEFFTQINKRKNLAVELTKLGVIPVYRIELTKRVDPFTLLERAKLTDGTSIDAAELRARLLKNPNADPLALEASDLDEEFARRIAVLTTVEVQLQAKNDAVKRIGPWQWEDFDHPELRETRGLLAAAAWLGWYDCRFDNNRLALAKTAFGRVELRHYITDLGATLSFYPGLFTYRYERPEQMEDSVTAKSWFRGVKIVHYRTMAPNRAFEEASEEDLRWGANWLSRLSPRQIHDAAIGAGFDERRAQLIVRKLDERLSNMKRDLK
jgi:hypothetical protein